MHIFDKVFVVSLIFLSSLFFCHVDASRHEKPFVAVFSNPGTWDYWEKYKPNFYYTAKDFTDLDIFLQEVKKRLHENQELVLDIDCHGSDTDGLLYIQYEAFNRPYSYSCSMGALLNKVRDSGLKPSKMYLESCYSIISMETTLTNNKEQAAKGEVIEDYKYDSVDYPIYGAGTCPSVNNLIYLEDKYQVMPYFHDLRESIGKDKEEADNNITTIYGLREIYSMLFCYGQ